MNHFHVSEDPAHSCFSSPNTSSTTRQGDFVAVPELWLIKTNALATLVWRISRRENCFKPLPSHQSNIIEDYAKNTRSWDKHPSYINPSSHCPPFPIKDIPRKCALQGLAQTALPSTTPSSCERERLLLTLWAFENDAVQSVVQGQKLDTHCLLTTIG